MDLDNSPIREYFNKLRNSLTELLAIGITDRDGIPLLIVCEDASLKSTLRQRYFATAYLVFEQSDRLGFGATNYTISYYKNHQIVSFNKDKLIVTVIATAEANTGHILSMEKEFTPIVKSMAEVISKEK